ncbi:MAG TPA: cbb3-type cytochrome c oxidase subunit I, partial [Planctomycetota bacterium]|nr:cbb3-type cytochrome c oxidase subunit I [Planctomycetota bacterium]
MTAVAVAATAAHDDDAAAVALVEKKLVQWHLIAGFFFFLTSTLWGFLVSLQFLHVYPFEGVSFLSAGRVRLLHTNEVAYGFLVNGFLGLLYYAVPRLTGRPVAGAKLGWFIFVVWQVTTLL